MKKVVIGLSGGIAKEPSKMVPGLVKTYLWDFYVDACRKNNAIPLLLPVVDDLEDVKSMLDRVDALILTGGYDVNPSLYGENPHQKLGEINPRRDAFDLALLKEALKRKMPIFAICRGFQLINVYFGGTLYQDISLRKEETFKHNQELNPEVATIDVEVEKDSILYKFTQKEMLKTNSFHHQMIKDLGQGLKITAKSKDGVIKAVEHKDIDNLIAVQWHPEMMFENHEDMNKLFVKFFEMVGDK